MIKFMILDVDGTITDQNRIISPDAMKNIKNGIEKGLNISLISGNVIPVMFGLKTFLGINGPVFGENGGIMYYNGKIEKFFSKEKPFKFLEYISTISSATAYFTNQWRETSAAFSMDPGDVEKVSTEAKKWNLNIVDSKFTWHIMNQGENKAYAVNIIKNLYGLNWDEILVAGDSDNDNPMFNLPVKKACPANATNTIKSLSDYISPESYGNEIGDIMLKFKILP
ncbi:phosphoglycolate phosphatase [Ferroplasma sp.]|uniref:phosphoglycolate phosphatase n=1 Tax=Ferroplasma sp. TaxID=2591003 RepID=UPI00307DFC51